MNEWISVFDELPPAFTPVWIYWRDREVLLGCYTYEGEDVPPKGDECCAEGWYSFDDEKVRWCYWWKSATGSSNIDKPLSPNKMDDSSICFPEVQKKIVFKRYEPLKESPLMEYGKNVQLRDEK